MWGFGDRPRLHSYQACGKVAVQGDLLPLSPKDQTSPFFSQISVRALLQDMLALLYLIITQLCKVCAVAPILPMRCLRLGDLH